MLILLNIPLKAKRKPPIPQICQIKTIIAKHLQKIIPNIKMYAYQIQKIAKKLFKITTITLLSTEPYVFVM